MPEYKCQKCQTKFEGPSSCEAKDTLKCPTCRSKSAEEIKPTDVNELLRSFFQRRRG